MSHSPRLFFALVIFQVVSPAFFPLLILWDSPNLCLPYRKDYRQMPLCPVYLLRWRVLLTFCLFCRKTMILSISAFWVTEITGMSLAFDLRRSIFKSLVFFFLINVTTYSTSPFSSCNFSTEVACLLMILWINSLCSAISVTSWEITFKYKWSFYSVLT
jgi:hypothetical protein